MEQMNVDPRAVLIAAILYMVVNFFWYSKWMFGPIWSKLSSIKESEQKKNKYAPVWSFLCALVIAYFLAFFEGYLGVTNVSDGMFVGFTIWLGFVATTQASKLIWCRCSPKLFAINAGAKLLSYLVMSGLIGA